MGRTLPTGTACVCVRACMLVYVFGKALHGPHSSHTQAWQGFRVVC